MAAYAEIFVRDGWRCYHCGASDQLSPHHRINRGMGGSKNPQLNAPSNIIALCWAVNMQLETTPVIAELGRKFGWKLTRGQDPLAVPVWDAQAQQWYRLDDEYGRTPTYATA